jgi:hypothetical protein
MAATYTLIASSTVGSSGASYVEFTSISTSYTDLKLVGSARTDRSDSYLDYVSLLPNGSSSSISMRRLYGAGSTAGSDTSTSYLLAEADGALATSSTFSNFEFYIPNYNSSNYKSLSIDAALENNSSTDNQMSLSAGLWSNTAAITSLRLNVVGGTKFVQYSTFYLYGIKNS